MQHVEVRQAARRSTRADETDSASSSSGASNDLPLKLTSAPARASSRRPPRAAPARPRGARAGTAASRTRRRRSNQPQPTRNACVPAPPLRPVVSRSKNTNGGRAGAPPANERRLAGRLARAAPRARRPRSRPCSAAGSQSPIDDEAVAVAPRPPSDVSRFGGRRRPACRRPRRRVRRDVRATRRAGADDPANAIGERAQTARPPRRQRPRVRWTRSVSSGPGTSEQQIEDPQRGGLRERPGVADRPDAAGAAVLALALGDQPPRRRRAARRAC